ncbi:MAG: hypothetical protein MHM6MM_003402 [Cercozoa sp. M6MM]
MGKAKRTKKFALVKRRLGAKDNRSATAEALKEREAKAVKKKTARWHDAGTQPSHMFFEHNEALGPPYRVLLDTNFINFAVKNKIDLVQGMMDCMLAKCIPCITDCVMAELEKLGQKYRVALRTAKDPRVKRLKCTHKGTYADDCLVHRVKGNRVFVVATCDKDLKRRLRKIPGVPIMYIFQHKFSVEQLPEAYGAPRNG